MAEAGNIQLNGDGTGAKNIPNPAIVHKDVIEMFPELDLTQILGEYGHMTSEGLASMVIDKMEQIPKKRGTKRKNTCNGNFEADLSLNSTVYDDLLESNSSDEDEAALAVGDLLIDKMLAELLHTLKAELRNQSHIDIDRSNISYMKTFLLDHFLGVRSEFVLRILPHFQMHLVPTAIACFFSENNFGVKLHTAAPSLPQHFWLKSAAPLLLRRTKKSGAYYGNNSEDFRREYQRYAKIMESLQQGEYAALLTTDLKLTKQCNLIKWVRTQPEERIECLVCFDQFTINRMVFCNAPTMPQGSFFADDYSMLSVDDHVFEIEDADQPGPSSRMYEKKPRLFHQPQPELSAAGHKETDKNVPNNNLVIPVSNEDQKVSTHAFCRGCVRGAAQAATEQQPLADGGVGLRCMVPDCNNPILYSEIRTLLKREVRVKLDERILEENIGMASIQNLERCKRCNFAVQLEVDKNVDKVFDCINCGAKFCRLCEREWDDDHFGVSCEELDRKTQRDKKDRDLEKKLNEAVIRKCPRCGIAFMKDAGCNKMTCRCGMTQCYLCRESAIDYTHFCQHLRDPKMPNWKCGECKKSCLLYEDAVKKDELMMQQIRVKEGAPSAPPQPQTPRGERTLADLHQALADLRRGLQAHQNAPANLPALPNAVQQNDAARMLQPPNQPQPPAPGNPWAAAAVAAFQHYGPQDVRQQLAQARQQVRQHAAEAVQQAAAVQARQNEAQAWQPAALARQNAQLYQAPPVHPPNAQNVFPVVQQPPFFFRQAQPFVGYLVGGGNFGAANVYVPNVDQQPQQQPAMVIQQPPQQQGNNNANPPPQVMPVHQIPPPPENPLMNVPPPPPQPNLNVNEELEILEVHLNQIIQDQQQPPAAAAVGLPAAPVVIDLELDDILDLVIEGQGAGHQEQQAAQQQPEQQGNNQ